MPFDAAALWWPPFAKLFTQLETLKLEPSAVSADALKATLAEYEPWLARGLAGFKPPSDASRRALEGEASLSIGSKKLPVEAGLRAAALDVSRTLDLDEIQAYVLLRRWVAKAGPEALAPPAGGGGGGATAAAGLAPAQRLQVAQLYWQERLHLLKAIEGLLLEGERAEGGPLLDVIEGALGQLLEASLEETTFQALQASLEGEAAPGGTAPAGAGALLPGAGAAASQPLAIAAYSGAGGGGGGAAAAAAAALADGRLQAAAAERCSLLSILLLIYYHPRKQCTPDRFLQLAKLFHARLFTRALPRGGGAGGEPSPAQLSIKLATLLLLEMLDVDKALAALAAGQPIDEAAYVFAAPAVKERVNAELASWWPSAAAAHSPVLLAWAAVLCLIKRSAEGGRGAGGEWEAHAAKAHETDALGTLRQLTTHAGIASNAAEMFNNIVLSAMSAAFAAFNFSPAALPLPQLELVTATLANLFRDQPALCEGFWACDRVTDEPLRHFLADLRALFPAFPSPLFTLLAALSATPDSAASAAAYLAQLPGLACLHVLPDPAVEEECNEDGDAYSRYAIPLPGARSLMLPQGVLGEVLPLPEGLASTDGLWTVPAGEDIERVQLISWRLTLPDGAGQWILLCRLAEALALVASGSEGGARAAAARAELAAGLSLLATFCSRDPQTALELLHVELPTAEGALEGGQRGPDLLALACQAAATLAALPDPPPAAIADCLAICGALAEGIPGRVAQELLSLCGAGPGLAAAAVPAGQAPELPLLGRVLAAEAAAGSYPATQAFLCLLTTLVSAASPAPALQALVAWVLQRVLAEHRHWRYALRAERWRLARLALRLVRLALLSAPSASPSPASLAGGAAASGGSAAAAAQEEGGSALAAAVAAVLQYDVGMAACLLTALPPNAEQLERTGAESRYAEEVAAVEECCKEWHRLLPVLLPAAAPAARLAPAAFFRPCPAADGAAGASSAAAVLLSYISYPYFSSGERALVMRSLHCLAAAAADAAPGAVFAVLLPQEGPEAGVAGAARGAIAAAFSPAAAAATPQLLGAACDVLVAAVRCHPSLLDALLFPCGLEQALLDKENKSGNAAGDAAAAAGPGAEGGSKGKDKGGKAPPPPHSCLDALWELLQQRERLAREQPAVLAKLLQVLSAFWQSSGAAFRAVAVLQRQPGLWGHLAALVEGAAQAGALPLPALRGGEGDEGAAAAAWAAQEPAAALLQAEACALQVAAAECYTWAASGGASGAPAGMPADLAALLSKLPGQLAPRLLERYSLPLPTAALLAGAQQAAAAGGLQLLGAALSDEALWRSMAEGAGLAPQLAAAAQPLLRQFGSQADAARMLADHAPQIAARNFATQHSAVEVAELVMRQAEVPERLAGDRELGACFAYDAALLQRRLGAVLVAQLDALRGLSGWLEAASVAASLEDARLAAATALKALLTAAHKHRAAGGGSADGAAAAGSAAGGDVSNGVPAAAVQAALAVLSEALGDVAAVARERTSAAQVAAAEALAIDPVGAHLLNAAEAAYALLLLVQRWAAGSVVLSAAEEDAAAALCSGLLQATGDWMETLEGSNVAGLSGSPDAQPAAASITQSLLAAALVLLPAAPAAADAPAQLSQAQLRLQATATALLPLLLAACHRQPAHLVLVVSLATALIERLVPSAAWLPLVRAHLHFGNLLHSLLLSLHAASQAAAQAAAAQAAAAVQRLQQQHRRHPHHVAPAELPPGGVLALPAPSQQQQPQQPQQQQQQAAAGAAQQQQEGLLGPLAAASVEEAALLLALQVAQSRAGAELLVEQGAVAHALALGKWLLAPEGGNLMGETPQPGGGAPAAGAAAHGRAGAAASAAAAGVVDYSNAYRQDGSPNPAHRLWCCVLSLQAVLLAALPGHGAVEGAALQLAVAAEPRLLLAAEPPAAGAQQPLTLAMAQEAKYGLFFLCGLARLAGQWRVMLPDSLPAFRRATAAFLDFAAAPRAEPISCAPVSALERAAARASEAASGSGAGAGSSKSGGKATPAASSSGGSGAVFELSKGWFEAAAAGAGGDAAAVAGGYAWQLAERLYSSAQYALAFQLAVSPEVGEEELAELGPEWVRPATLLALQEDALGVADECGDAARRHPAGRRLARTLQALLGLSSQLQDSMGAERPHHHKQAVATAIARLAAVSAGRRG